ncbi:MAG: hypothetical protein ACREJ3_20455 [Polyangiaceae bacterium]
MQSNSARVPHFLRVTQALALVSGIGAPCAALLIAATDCGSSAPSPGPGTCANACVGAGVAADDGSPPYDGSSAYDGSPLGVGVVTWGVMVAPDASTPGSGDGGAAPDATSLSDASTDASESDGAKGPSDAAFLFDHIIIVGGPLAPPDLPA